MLCWILYMILSELGCSFCCIVLKSLKIHAAVAFVASD
jgi:hypothetical protein